MNDDDLNLDPDDNKRTLEEQLARELIGADELGTAFDLSAESTSGKGKGKEVRKPTIQIHPLTKQDRWRISLALPLPCPPRRPMP
jgi:hypothetical protein